MDVCLRIRIFMYTFFITPKTRSLRTMYARTSTRLKILPQLFLQFYSAAEKSRTSKIAKIKRALLCTVHTYSKNILICHSRDKLNVGETNSFYHILYCCAKHTLTHGAKKLYLVLRSSNSSTKSDGDEANSPVCSYSYCSYYSF